MLCELYSGCFSIKHEDLSENLMCKVKLRMKETGTKEHCGRESDKRLNLAQQQPGQWIYYCMQQKEKERGEEEVEFLLSYNPGVPKLSRPP